VKAQAVSRTHGVRSSIRAFRTRFPSLQASIPVRPCCKIFALPFGRWPTLAGLAADKPPSFLEWLIAEREPDKGELRHLILVDPVLDLPNWNPVSYRSMRSEPPRSRFNSTTPMACTYA